MSNIQLRSEIESIIKNSGYEKSKDLICPISKIVSMRYRDISQRQIFKVIMKVL